MDSDEIHVTPFESQMLQVFANDEARLGKPVSYHLAYVAKRGKATFGDGWPGSKTPGSWSYPLLTRFAGRLLEKGLLHRHADPHESTVVEGWTVWELTDMGREFLRAS